MALTQFYGKPVTKFLGLIGVFVLRALVLCGQPVKPFDLSETFQDSASMKTEFSFKNRYPGFFEDEKYKVTRTCSGEWGGSIWFKNKQGGITRSCEATCPVCVNKLNGKYYVTATLAHLSGFSEILEIDHPDSMRIFKMPKPRRIRGKKFVRYVGDSESKSRRGARVLVDSVGILTLGSFPYQGRLYYIVTDFKKTFVAKITADRFVTLDTVSSVSLWTYDPTMTRTVDDHYVMFFANSAAMGYIDIFENKIAVYRTKGH